MLTCRIILHQTLNSAVMDGASFFHYFPPILFWKASKDTVIPSCAFRVVCGGSFQNTVLFHVSRSTWFFSPQLLLNGFLNVVFVCFLKRPLLQIAGYMSSTVEMLCFERWNCHSAKHTQLSCCKRQACCLTLQNTHVNNVCLHAGLLGHTLCKSALQPPTKQAFPHV